MNIIHILITNIYISAYTGTGMGIDHPTFHIMYKSTANKE